MIKYKHGIQKTITILQFNQQYHIISHQEHFNQSNVTTPVLPTAGIHTAGMIHNSTIQINSINQIYPPLFSLQRESTQQEWNTKPTIHSCSPYNGNPHGKRCSINQQDHSCYPYNGKPHSRRQPDIHITHSRQQSFKHMHFNSTITYHSNKTL